MQSRSSISVEEEAVVPGGNSVDTSELKKLHLINRFVSEKVATKGNKPPECVAQPLERFFQCNRNVKAPEDHICLCCIHLAAVQHIDLGLLGFPCIL